MASEEAICRLRVGRSLLHEEQVQSATQKELLSAQYALEEQPLSPVGDISSIPIETRCQWAKLISHQILDRGEIDDGCGVRDWDFRPQS